MAGFTAFLPPYGLRALFYPDLASPCVQGKHLIYRWNGEHIVQVLEVSAVKRPKS